MPATKHPDAVTVRDRDGVLLAIPFGRELQRLAMSWRYVARHRDRWRGEEGRAELRRKARAELGRIAAGWDDGVGERVAAAELLEVEVPFAREDAGWEGRIAPWETLLLLLCDRAPLVVRRLRLDASGPAPPPPAGGVVGVAAVAAGLPPPVAVRGKAVTETGATGLDLDALRRRLAAERPRIVTVSGYDAREAAQRLGLDGTQDGLLLPDAAGRPTLVAAADAAVALGASAPELVTFHVGHSASRLAPLTVAAGAGAAVGLRDAVDRLAVADFYEAFYAALDGATPIDAFRAALARRPAGAGLLARADVVLWTRESAFASVAVGPEGDFRRRLLGAEGTKGASPLVLHAARGPQVEVLPVPTVNVSLLHNRKPLFDSFWVHVPRGREPMRVDVEVTLHVGREPIAWRRTFPAVAPGDRLSLRDDVFLPLTWALGRRLPESVKTALVVRVACDGGACLHDTTYPVDLLPFDEWRDDDAHRAWLPSFVLPRDPAVADVVARADGHLVALVDDPHAGFDGYQSVDPRRDDPWERVDLQARAIWTVLVHELRPRYVNPPPTYRAQSQRLRSPSEVRAAGRGTCIDLALFVAACLEHVGIDPVLVLLHGHACVGYWRRESEWVNRLADVARTVAEGDPGGVADDAEPSWALGPTAWAAVVDLVERGELVVLETVALTTGGGFGRAAAEGFVDLRSRDDFQLLLDVCAARAEGVTPLPLEDALG